MAGRRRSEKKRASSQLKRPDKSEGSARPELRITKATILGAFFATAWFLTAAAIAGRTHSVLNYSTLSADNPFLDPVFASNGPLLAATVLASIWFFLFRTETRSEDHISGPSTAFWAQVFLGLSLLPLLLLILRGGQLLSFAPTFAEPIWFAAFTGLSFASLSESVRSLLNRLPNNIPFAAISVISLGAATWWYAQSVWYYDHFLLGFNDFGHFAQRIVNTAEGRGFLLESPVLPTYWDHFNPAIAAIAPLWLAFPSVHLFFVLQALCLSASAVLIYRISIASRGSTGIALLWSLAWLAQPSLGQMNIAYSYGWHPISLAIPCMLFSFLLLLKSKHLLAVLIAIPTMLIEEGVIVVLGCFCFACFLQSTLLAPKQEQNSTRTTFGLSSTVWLAGFVICVLAFGLVYAFSGIADFQTGRFVALGATAAEVLTSPVTNPSAFWGQLFSMRNTAYLLCILLPCSIFSILRGWKLAIATILPFLVLLVWDHVPATSLAFQYAATLLPVLWLAAIQFNNNETTPASNLIAHFQKSGAVIAFTTGITLSIFVGQLPFSATSNLEMTTATYPFSEKNPDPANTRSPDKDLTKWLNEEIAAIRADGGEVLSTSRIASHLVGNRDIETVGQYIERREKLAQLSDRSGAPIRHYRWIVLDRDETFQQSPEAIQEVIREAESNGFSVYDRNEAIVIYLGDGD